MKRIFYCLDCKLKFTAQGTKTSLKDKIYGPCQRWTAKCPNCYKPAGEVKQKQSQKNYPQTNCQENCPLRCPACGG